MLTLAQKTCAILALARDVRILKFRSIAQQLNMVYKTLSLVRESKEFESLFLQVIFSLVFGFIATSHAQTKLQDRACASELGELLELHPELVPETPKSLVNFDLPDYLKTSLIDLMRLRIALNRSSDQSLKAYYLNELKKLENVFLEQGYTEEFFNQTHIFFFEELSQRAKAREQEIEAQTSLVRIKKDEMLRPLIGRTRQVIDEIVAQLGILEDKVTFKDLEKITELSLVSKDITALIERDFDGLINLRVLYLSDNRLKQLPENVFQGLESLEEIHLSNNHLQELPEKIFQGLTSLEGIFLGYNRLETFPDNVFEGLGSLVWLELSYNRITEISESAFSAPGLNPKFKVSLRDLPLNFETRKMLADKYYDNVKGLK